MGSKEEIKLIAYRIWEQEGCQHGHDIEHWCRAELVWQEQQKAAKTERSAAKSTKNSATVVSNRNNQPTKNPKSILKKT